MQLTFCASSQILLSFFGNFINALGYIIQKLAHHDIQRDRDVAHKALCVRLSLKMPDMLTAPRQSGRLSFKLERAGFVKLDSLQRILTGEKSTAAALSTSQETEEILRENIVEAEQRLYTSHPLWLGGFLTYGIGSLLHVASLGFGPQALLMPLEGVTLAANALLAPMFLGERLTCEGERDHDARVDCHFDCHTAHSYVSRFVLSLSHHLVTLLQGLFPP